jgi:hypothetical protein
MKTISSRIGTVGLGLGLMFFWASPSAEALSITNVVVTIGPDVFNSASVGWTFPVNLLPGQDLVLSQDLPGTATSTTSYNFDTSEAMVGVPQISITADGITTVFSDTNGVLNVKNRDGENGSDNEAQNYGAPLIGPGYQLFLGYFDNVHTGPCGAWASSIGLNGSTTCVPTPFFGATSFQGKGALDPGLIETLANHCSETLPNCWDAGVLRIVADPGSQVPEPATVSLLLTGLAVLTARGYRQARKKTQN